MLTVPLDELIECIRFFAKGHEPEWVYADATGVHPRRIAEVIALTIEEAVVIRPVDTVAIQRLIHGLRIGEADFLIALTIETIKEDLC